MMMISIRNVFVAFFLISKVGAFTRWNVLQGRQRSCLHLRLSSNEPPSPDVPVSTSTDPSLDALFEQIADMNPDDVPPDLQRSIQEKIDQGAPAAWKVRLQMMGFTPLTIAGYGVAFVLIALNTILGTGWASTMLGLDEEPLMMDKYSIGRDSETPTMLPGNRREAIDEAIKANIEEIRQQRTTPRSSEQ